MALYIALIIAVVVDIVVTVTLCVIDVIECRRYKRLIDLLSRKKGEAK
jgi:hypothetical protein